MSRNQLEADAPFLGTRSVASCADDRAGRNEEARGGGKGKWRRERLLKMNVRIQCTWANESKDQDVRQDPTATEQDRRTYPLNRDLEQSCIQP